MTWDVVVDKVRLPVDHQLDGGRSKTVAAAVVVVEVGGVHVSARRIPRGRVCHPSAFWGKPSKSSIASDEFGTVGGPWRHSWLLLVLAKRPWST